MTKKPPADQVWNMVLRGELPGLRRVRRLFKLLPADRRCKNCYAPLSGSGAPLMRLIGRRPYNKNPQFCNHCMWLCRAYPGGTEIEISLVFADVRGSTTLAESMTPGDFGQLMNRFYDVTTEVLIHTDAFIDKLVGDEVVGLYFPGYAGANHPDKAVQAAQGLLSAVGYGTTNGPWLPIGIGVHTGLAYVGTVQGAEGTVADFAALGDTVHIAARLASIAGQGEALISEATCAAVGPSMEKLEQRQLELKGRSLPVRVRVLRPWAG